jgi:cytochrome c oxidase subunit 2
MTCWDGRCSSILLTPVIVGTPVNMMVVPGQISKLTVRFDRPGEYLIVCHEYCGSGHHVMSGKVIVR